MKSELFVLGITGPTGAGKGELSAYLRERGVPVIDADLLSREVTSPGHPCLAELAAAFSPAILHEDGSLNRAALAAVAFSTLENTARLNSIVHPHVIALSNARLAALREEGKRAAAIDAPLLFESGMDAVCDRTVAVLAPADLRFARIVERDGLTEEQARARMSAQPHDEYYIARATDILQNEGDIDKFRAAVRGWCEGWL